MKTIYHAVTGEVREVDSVDARELIATGRWSESPTVVSSLSTDDMTVLELRAALKLAGVAMPHGASKVELVALYNGAQG